MNGIVEVRPNVAFKVVIENYDSGEYRLVKNQTLAHLLLHAVAIVPKSISLIEILGVVEETLVSE